MDNKEFEGIMTEAGWKKLEGIEIDWEKQYPVEVKQYICRSCGTTARKGELTGVWCCPKCGFATDGLYLLFRPLKESEIDTRAL